MLRSFVPVSLVAGLCCIISSAAPALAQDRSLWMYSGESSSVSGYFLEGESIYGTCDADCSDLDLFLYDGAGNLVASDTLLDAVPIVTAPYAGDFTVTVSMPSCSTSAGCAVGISSDNGF